MGISNWAGVVAAGRHCMAWRYGVVEGRENCVSKTGS